MAARLLTRSKTLTISHILHHASPVDPIAASQCLRTLHSLTSQWRLGPLDPGRVPPPDCRSMPSGFITKTDLSSASPSLPGHLGTRKILGYDQSFPRWFCMKAQGGAINYAADKVSYHDCQSAEQKILQTTAKAVGGIKGEEGVEKVIAFSPLEGTITKKRASGLESESLKMNRAELANRITYYLIPALLVTSKSSLTTSLLIFSVYWQMYGFYKEIFLDYIHQEVTRKWVLIYFRLLLLILAKDTILYFGLV